jgi:hypothetical protein
LLICQLSAVAAVPATDRGERIGRPGCPGYCLGGASLDQARPASAMTRLPTRLWATRNRNYVQPLQYSAGRTNRTIMSSSSNTNIAKKARTKAEADFATWLMMATTLYPYLQEGRWVLLQVAAESNATPVRGAINIVSLAPGANDGLLGKFASMLVRPDGLPRPRERGRRRRRHRVRRLIARAGPCSGSRRLHLCPSVLTTP